MRSSSIKQILAAGLLGLVAAFILVEVLLRVMGAVYLKRTAPQEPIVIADDKDHFNVLCTGASWTAGHGAPPGEDYPSQLENILKEKVDGKTFTVFRRAMVNHNTAQILARLEEDIDETDPDLVVLMGGVANAWNHWGLLAYRHANGALAASSDALENIKTYKLTKLLASDVKSKQNRTFVDYAGKRREEERIMEGLKAALAENPYDGYLYARIGFTYLRRNNAVRAEEYFAKGIEKIPGFSINYTGLGAVNALEGNFEDSVEWYERAIEISPRDGQNYAGLGWVYCRQREYERSVGYYKKALEISPESVEGEVWRGGHIAIAQAYAALGEKEKADAHYGKSKFGYGQKVEKTPEEKEAHREIAEWIKADYGQMIEICRGKGVPVILQTFPNNTYDQEGIGINQAIREIAEEEGVPLVDQYALFLEVIEKEGLRRGELFEFASDDNYFIVLNAAPGKNIRILRSAEGHCNSKGYRLMAENIYSLIEKEGLLVRK